MSTIVCKNHTETTTLQLKLAAQLSDSRRNLAIEFDQNDNNREFGSSGFEFLRSPPNESEIKNHAWAHKPSFSGHMSAKSLELCTENFGSETGCEIVAGGDFISFALPAPIKSNQIDRSAPVAKGDGIGDNDTWKKITRFPKNPNHNFPPPLTNSLQVRRHSEGGRLIMEAVAAPFRNSYMQANRSDGKLRLCFLTPEPGAITASADGEEAAAAEKEEESESNSNLEMEIEKFQWVRRCQEGGRHGNKWKPAVWVATS